MLLLDRHLVGRHGTAPPGPRTGPHADATNARDGAGVSLSMRSIAGRSANSGASFQAGEPHRISTRNTESPSISAECLTGWIGAMDAPHLVGRRPSGSPKACAGTRRIRGWGSVSPGV